jgi:hypothetical protein
MKCSYIGKVQATTFNHTGKCLLRNSAAQYTTGLGTPRKGSVCIYLILCVVVWYNRMLPASLERYIVISCTQVAGYILCEYTTPVIIVMHSKSFLKISGENVMHNNKKTMYT